MIAWPTNLGWMMGPWLIYASLLNGAAIAVYEGNPLGAGFARFVEVAEVAMLGVVPSLVKAWRASGVLDTVNWRAIRRFSSTGEASQPEDMAWLMQRAGGAVAAILAAVGLVALLHPRGDRDHRLFAMKSRCTPMKTSP